MTIHELIDMLEPAFDGGCQLIVYKEDGDWNIDLETRAKSNCILKLEEGKVTAYCRYNETHSIENFDDVLYAVSTCKHRRDYMDGSWAKLLEAVGYNLDEL